MILKSFSKINLSLSVNNKLSNGLHNIQSYFCLINLIDQIKIKENKKKKDIIKFRGKFTKYINNKKNSISDVLKVLREQNILTNNYTVIINKKIPVFGGLGGGTGNAACIIKYFIKKKINKKLLTILSKKIGSDLQLFFYNQGFQKNLKKINNFKKNYNLIFLLVYPNIKSSTKNVYSKVKKYSLKSKNYFNKSKKKEHLVEFLNKASNDLQSIVEKKYPIIRKIVREIDQNKGCYFSRMTGSGSVCYGMFTSEKTAKAALKAIKTKYPKFWFSVAKTI